MVVGRPKVMAPFGNAVGFVNGYARQFSMLVDNFENVAKRLGQYKLGRNIEQSYCWMTYGKIST